MKNRLKVLVAFFVVVSFSIPAVNATITEQSTIEANLGPWVECYLSAKKGNSIPGLQSENPWFVECPTLTFKCQYVKDIYVRTQDTGYTLVAEFESPSDENTATFKLNKIDGIELDGKHAIYYFGRTATSQSTGESSKVSINTDDWSKAVDTDCFPSNPGVWIDTTGPKVSSAVEGNMLAKTITAVAEDYTSHIYEITITVNGQQVLQRHPSTGSNNDEVTLKYECDLITSLTLSSVKVEAKNWAMLKDGEGPSGGRSIARGYLPSFIQTLRGILSRF
jgi:hypothetical protein